MKKVYYAPQMKVVMLEGADLIAMAGSDYNWNEYGGNDQGGGAGD